ncbi:MAG: hypothetical protein V1899_12520 [Planctomycetota bacterium]
MNPKPQPNHREYIEVLRRMTPEERLLKAFELSNSARELFREGLRQAFPELSEKDFEELYKKRLDLCHNRNW